MMLKRCPFKYKRYNPLTGKDHASADNVFPDDKERNKLCNHGKGPWCAQCMTYKQSQMSNDKWKRIYRGMKTTGKAPHLQKKAIGARVVDPLGLRLSHGGGL